MKKSFGTTIATFACAIAVSSTATAGPFSAMSSSYLPPAPGAQWAQVALKHLDEKCVTEQAWLKGFGKPSSGAQALREPASTSPDCVRSLKHASDAAHKALVLQPRQHPLIHY